MNLLVKFPTRSRPEKFLEVLGKYHELSTSDAVRYLITIDSDDATMANPAMLERIAKFKNTEVIQGRSENKIHAVNRDMERSGDWDILVLASDDMMPVKRGWDLLIQLAFQNYFPDGDGVVHFTDGHTPLNTQVIIGRKYYERFGYIYHPSYRSLWCDNEFQRVSWELNKCVFINECIIEHQHWTNGYGQPDALMRKTESLYNIDKQNFERRKRVNFGLK